MPDFPQTFRVRQLFDATRVEDVPAEVEAQLARLRLGEKIRPGQTVAVTVGSRGIAGIDVITRAAVEHLKHLGARPFIVPAMGSHGGGTAEGQRALLASLGIDEQTIGVPIRASMDVVQLGETQEGVPVYQDAIASRAAQSAWLARSKTTLAYVRYFIITVRASWRHRRRSTSCFGSPIPSSSASV